MAAPIPFQTLQSGRPLEAGKPQVALTAGAGAAGPWGGAGGGLGARIRVPYFHHGDVGLSFQAIGHSGDYAGTAVSGRFGFRISGAPGFAWLAGVGYSRATTADALGGDLGAVLDLSRRWYVSARGGVALPTSTDVDDGDDEPSDAWYGLLAVGYHRGATYELGVGVHSEGYFAAYFAVAFTLLGASD